MNDWIKDLKVGDKVIISIRFSEQIAKVENITPAGNIKANGRIFKPNGIERSGDVWERAYLREATPEKITEITHQNIIAKAMRLMKETKSITVEQAKNIIFLLNKDERKKE